MKFEEIDFYDYKIRMCSTTRSTVQTSDSNITLRISKPKN